LLAFSCEKRKLRAGEKLFSHGESAGGAYFVLEGEITLRKDATERRAGPGALLGELALLTETTRPADAAAECDSVVLTIPRETFRRVLTEFPESAAKVQRVARARARALIVKLERVRRRGFGVTSGKRP
jgi:CRP-like cAMP-binding protein